MPLYDWMQSPSPVAWITTGLGHLQSYLEGLGFSIVQEIHPATGIYYPSVRSVAETVVLCVDQDATDCLDKAMPAVFEAYRNSGQKLRFLMQVAASINRPLAGIDTSADTVLDTLSCREFLKNCPGANDQLGITWFHGPGKRERFRLQRTIWSQDRTRGAIQEMGIIPVGELVNVRVGSSLNRASSLSAWIGSARKKPIGTHLFILEWLNGRIIVRGSQIIGKEIFLRRTAPSPNIARPLGHSPALS